MEPVTHVLTGACLARSGLNRRAAYATLTMAIAAELPDIDTLWGLRGPISGFEHHRGITHTFLGIPFEAALLVLCIFLLHQVRLHRSRRLAPQAARPSSTLLRAPLRWGELYVYAVLALLSHILLDYTNNYGVRPFFPFDPHWYAASIVFIFDPLLFLLLLGGLLLPALFGFVGQEIAGKAEPFRGTAWSRAALVAVLLLWSFRAYEHGKALDLANSQSLRAPVRDVQTAGSSSEASLAEPDSPSRPLLRPNRSLASPDPLSPFRWYIATDYGPSYGLGTIDTLRSAFSPGRVLDKPAPDRFLNAAKASHLGRVYLDWSPMPWLSVSTDGPITASTSPGTETTVNFEDVRFMNSLSFLNTGPMPPLTGRVILGSEARIVAEGIDGRFGR